MVPPFRVVLRSAPDVQTCFYGKERVRFGKPLSVSNDLSRIRGMTTPDDIQVIPALAKLESCTNFVEILSHRLMKAEWSASGVTGRQRWQPEPQRGAESQRFANGAKQVR
jgi:hypothetical protein